MFTWQQVQDIVTEFKAKREQLENQYEPNAKTFEFYHRLEALEKEYQARLDRITTSDLSERA